MSEHGRITGFAESSRYELLARPTMRDGEYRHAIVAAGALIGVRVLGWVLVAVAVALGGVFVGLVWSWPVGVLGVAIMLFVYGCVLTAASEDRVAAKAPQREADVSTR